VGCKERETRERRGSSTRHPDAPDGPSSRDACDEARRARAGSSRATNRATSASPAALVGLRTRWDGPRTRTTLARRSRRPAKSWQWVACQRVCDRGKLQVWNAVFASASALGGMTDRGAPATNDGVLVPSHSRVLVCCDACYRTSPAHDGPLDRAQDHFRAMGWMWRRDGRLLCPICTARESTLPPPP
jgi:hypothetical protein